MEKFYKEPIAKSPRIDMLKDAGFGYYNVFSGRKTSEIKF